MSLSVRNLTRTTMTVYDEQENLIGRVYRDGHKTWWAQHRTDTAQWAMPISCASRVAALRELEQRS